MHFARNFVPCFKFAVFIINTSRQRRLLVMGKNVFMANDEKSNYTGSGTTLLIIIGSPIDCLLQSVSLSSSIHCTASHMDVVVNYFLRVKFGYRHQRVFVCTAAVYHCARLKCRPNDNVDNIFIRRSLQN